MSFRNAAGYNDSLFRSLCSDLKSIPKFTSRNTERVVELIRSISESLVWSDQHKANYFEIFVEMQMPGVLTRLLKVQSLTPILKQLIQTATMFIHNLSDMKSKKYLLDLNYYEEVIMHYFDLPSDDLVEFYASLLKSMTVNLDTATLEEFLISKNHCLFNLAKMFVFYSESMVRTASRSAILTISRIENPKIRWHIFQSSFALEFVWTFKQKLKALDQLIYESSQFVSFERAVSDEIDNIYYVHDLLKEDIPEVQEQLLEALTRCLIIPVLLGSLASEKHNEHHISIQLSYFILAAMLQVIKYQPIVNLIADVMVSPTIKTHIFNLCLQEPPQLQEIEDGLNPILEEDSSELVNNPVREMLMAFMQSKDDTMISLSLLIVQAVFSNSSIDPAIIERSDLLSQSSNLVETQALAVGNRKKLVLEILELMCTDPPLRILCCKLLGNVLMKLTYDDESQQCSLSPDDRCLLIKAYLQSIERLLALVSRRENMKETLQFLEEESSKISKISFKEILQCSPYLLIPSNQYPTEVPFEFKTPHSELESMKFEIYLFLLNRKIYSLLCENEEYFDILPQILISNNNQKSWRLGESYEISWYTQTPCVVQIQDSEERLHLVGHEDLFLLVEPDSSKVRKVAKLREVKITTNKNDPRVLNISIKKKMNSQTMVLFFPDPGTCKRIKQTLRVNRVTSIQYETSLFESLLNSLIFSLNKP